MCLVQPIGVHGEAGCCDSVSAALRARDQPQCRLFASSAPGWRPVIAYFWTSNREMGEFNCLAWDDPPAGPLSALQYSFVRDLDLVGSCRS